MTIATTRIGSRDIAVERSPLPVKFGGGHFKFTLSQPEEGLLRLLPGQGIRVFGWILGLIGWPIFLLGLVSILGLMKQPTRENLVAVLLLLGFGSPFAFFGLAILGRRLQFDTRAHELTIRHFGRTRRRSLMDVLAVQVINAGRFGNQDGESAGFVSYQLNLILDDPNEPRLFVAYNSDITDMATKAKQLAEFLTVPLLMTTDIAQDISGDGSQETTTLTGGPLDPTRDWAKMEVPQPLFDLEAGALGRLKLGDGFEQAQFLGRPDRVDRDDRLKFYYFGRGFELHFDNDQFVELLCHISLRPDDPPVPELGFSQPKFSSGFELTPETSVAELLERFGTPATDSNYAGTRFIEYVPGRYYMTFEVEEATGRLMIWSAVLEE